MDLMLFNEVIAFDHYRQKIMLITGVMTEDIEGSYQKAEETLEDMAKLIREGEKENFPTLQLKTEIEPVFPKEQYCNMVEKAKQYIREGDIFQVVLSEPDEGGSRGQSVRYIPGAPGSKSVAVHVLLFQRRHRAFGSIAGNAGKAGQRQAEHVPAGGNTSARQNAGRGQSPGGRSFAG